MCKLGDAGTQVQAWCRRRVTEPALYPPLSPKPSPLPGACLFPLCRVEVRDLSGEIHSVLFYPEAGTSRFSFRDLRVGCTLCIRYAQRCFFSDLATEAIKV